MLEDIKKTLAWGKRRRSWPCIYNRTLAFRQSGVD